ncbi:hypothetical protein [uncultured Nostoc sp.]
MVGKLDGKVGVITGASSGIGEATAIAYAITQPARVSVNEILIHPSNQEM